MTNNLEGIPFDTVHNRAGTSYAVYRETLRPYYLQAWLDITKGYFFLALVTITAILLPGFSATASWFYMPVAAVLTGYTAAYIALFAHEAGHYNLHPGKKTNDLLATLFVCLLFGLSIKSYRKIHWQHHLHLGTPADTETSYFHHLNNLFLLETLTGIHLLRTVVNKDGSRVLNPAQARESRLMLLAGFLLHGLLLTLAFYKGYWQAALIWIAGFGIFFPFFASLRQLLEHRDELAAAQTDFRKTPHGKLSRLFYHSLLSSSFGAAGFTRHLIHHWDPQVSYTRMKDIEQFLEEDRITGAVLKSSRTTYSKTFRKLYSRT